MSKKDKLKEWDLLKTKKEYDFFYRITKMMSNQKIEEFGVDFLHVSIITAYMKSEGK
jgi:hypothetical protein